MEVTLFLKASAALSPFSKAVINASLSWSAHDFKSMLYRFFAMSSEKYLIWSSSSAILDLYSSREDLDFFFLPFSALYMPI